MDTKDILSDIELIASLKHGDRDAFNHIYYRYSQLLFQYAFNILRDEEECTDAIQEIFIWLWQNRNKIEVVSLKGYLFAAVKYKLARVITAGKRHLEILAASPHLKESFIDDSLEIKELQTAISLFTETLPPRAKLIFKLSRIEYFSNREISAQLGISEKTVENQLTITLKKLKINLGKLSFWTLFF